MYPIQARISALKTLISRIFCLENLDFKDFLLRKPIFQRRLLGTDAGNIRTELIKWLIVRNPPVIIKRANWIPGVMMDFQMPTTYSSVNKIRILRKNIKYNMPWSAMVTVRIFICFAFELNVLRFLLSRCRPCSRCFCWHIQSKMKQLNRQLVSMKPTRGLTSFAMNFLLDYGKGAGLTKLKQMQKVFMLPFPSAIFQQAMGHHLAFVNSLLVKSLRFQTHLLWCFP